MNQPDLFDQADKVYRNMSEYRDAMRGAPTLAELLRDLCARKHGGNEQSVEAFERLAPHLPTAEQRVLDVIRTRGDHEYTWTAKEVAAVLGVELNTISGRFGAGLGKAGLIRRIHEGKCDTKSEILEWTQTPCVNGTELCATKHGKRVTRDGCAVWVATEGGQA